MSDSTSTRARRRAFVVVGSLAAFGALAPSAWAVPSSSGCPEGWFEESAPAGDLYDANGDGIICTKFNPGNGDGNSANSQRGDGQTGFHVDGHNHKDNNNL